MYKTYLEAQSSSSYNVFCLDSNFGLHYNLRRHWVIVLDWCCLCKASSESGAVEFYFEPLWNTMGNALWGFGPFRLQVGGCLQQFKNSGALENDPPLHLLVYMVGKKFHMFWRDWMERVGAEMEFDSHPLGME